MEAIETVDQSRGYALVALATLALGEVVGSFLFIFDDRLPFLQNIPAVPIGTVLTH